MNRYQLRFDDARTAQQAQEALRRRGFQIKRQYIDLFIVAKAYKDLDSALKSWALRRGALPEWFLIDVEKL